jgi:hypothetical protein
MIARLHRLAPVLALAAVATLWASGDIHALATNLMSVVVVAGEGWSR